MFNFDIKDKGSISRLFLAHRITDFKTACSFIAGLPYKRNTNKDDLTTVFTENGGTCSTKHAVLQKLCMENEYEQVKLVLGIFKMDGIYAPSIVPVLQAYGLSYIPEAHNYLLVEGTYLDFTKPGADYTDFKEKLLQEALIDYTQITTYKVQQHKHFLAAWLQTTQLSYSLDELWQIREKCIAALQA